MAITVPITTTTMPQSVPSDTTVTTTRQSRCETCLLPFERPLMNVLGSHVDVSDDGKVLTTTYFEHICPHCGDHVAWDESEREEVRGPHA